MPSTPSLTPELRAELRRRIDQAKREQITKARGHYERARARDSAPCGTRSAYNGGCRCLACRGANTAYRLGKHAGALDVFTGPH